MSVVVSPVVGYEGGPFLGPVWSDERNSVYCMIVCVVIGCLVVLISVNCQIIKLLIY